jgi:hypothetical protein
MTYAETEYRARQIEDRQIGVRKWIYWLLTGGVSLLLWLAVAMVAIQVGRLR